ncbi:unnamed protein product [Fraxinus pennsylvanica]|uniref:Cytochrome P450 n=1 Tax=Fraxinus pennsylvanica TaxID=56036 RepID=A0AAD2A893_9LAMI|nr:unnamed protein product [Fraxinus pennsylvanica]
MTSLELGRVSVQKNAFEVVRQEIDQRLLPLLASVAGTEDEILDIQDVFKRFSFDSICRVSFGLDPKCLDLSLPITKFAAAFDLASKLSAERAMTASPLLWKMKRLFNIGSERKLKQAINIINMLAQEVIRQRRKFRFSEEKDLLSRFMGTVTDEKYLRDVVISFLLAGRDTVASALTSFFWLMAKHPEVEAAILVEADRVIGENKELTSYKKLKELHYLHAAVYESMRLYPPIQFDSKFCLEDDLLPDGTSVKKGTRVTYHPYAMGRMEEIWGSDCTEFKPERWLKNDGLFFQENPFKYPVFQAGVRPNRSPLPVSLPASLPLFGVVYQSWSDHVERHPSTLRELHREHVQHTLLHSRTMKVKIRRKTLGAFTKDMERVNFLILN